MAVRKRVLIAALAFAVLIAAAVRLSAHLYSVKYRLGPIAEPALSMVETLYNMDSSRRPLVPSELSAVAIEGLQAETLREAFRLARENEAGDRAGTYCISTMTADGARSPSAALLGSLRSAAHLVDAQDCWITEYRAVSARRWGLRTRAWLFWVGPPLPRGDSFEINAGYHDAPLSGSTGWHCRIEYQAGQWRLEQCDMSWIS